jgi:dienelactone hydrolase
MGLLWSMRPADRRLQPERASLLPPDAGLSVRFDILAGGRRVATTTALRRNSAETVTSRTLTLEREGFVGSFYVGPSTKPGPALLLLGGSEGGLTGQHTGPLFASHGFPTLALAYFGEPGLPSELMNIPLEYFVPALGWLRGQPGVDPERIFVLGVSRGSEAALLLGARYPELVYGVVGYVLSSVVNPSPLDRISPAWTHEGKPVPFDVIPVERIKGPVFLVSAVEDQLWPSSTYASAIVARLKAHGRSDVVSLTYGHAGHGVGTAVPFLPMATVVPSRRYGTVLDLGGTRAGDSRARADSWPKLLRYLEQARR